MTTIAATRYRMAADSRVIAPSGCFPSDKLWRSRDGIIGAAGESVYCSAVIRWLSGKGRKPRVPASAGFEALYLTKDGLYYLEYDLTLNPIHDGMYAVGTGAQYALGCMERDRMLGEEPCPIAAVEAACRRDPHSAGPVSFLTLARE